MPSKPPSCCKCLLITTAVIVVASLGGVLIWHFLPDDTKQQVQEVTGLEFNNTNSDGTNVFGGGGNGNDSGSGGTGAGITSYEFLQCNSTSTEQCCNGLTGLCSLRVDEIMYGYVHNAVASDEDGFTILVNQDFSLEKSLTAGFRAMELDVGRCGVAGTSVNAEPVFFHAQCLLGTRSISTVLTNINTFLNENPNEVIILKLEMADDTVSIADVADIMDTVDTNSNQKSFRNRLYQKQDSTTAWPTLGELVALDQRIILFYYNAASCDNQVNANGVAVGCPTGFHFWFQYGVNTQFSFDTIEDIEDTANSCTLSGAGANSQADFFRVNAFLKIPSRTVADTVNAETFANKRNQDCSALNNNLPVNFYSVDFWDRGDVPKVVQDRNRALIASAKAKAVINANAN
jgi:hypothetical protein